MQTKLTLSNAQVNDGKVQSSERPVFVGVTKVADNTNGRLMNTSVTIDRDWLWVRFSSEPSEAWKSKVQSQGFVYSRKRKGWHVLVEESKCKFVQELGALSVTMERVAEVATQSVLEGEGSMVLSRGDEIDVDMSDDKSKGKRYEETEARIKERRSKKAEPKKAEAKKVEVATPSADVARLLAIIEQQQATIAKRDAQIDMLIAKLVA